MVYTPRNAPETLGFNFLCQSKNIGDTLGGNWRCMGIGPGNQCMEMVSSACLMIAKRDFTIGTLDGLQERRPGSAKLHPIVVSVFTCFQPQWGSDYNINNQYILVPSCTTHTHIYIYICLCGYVYTYLHTYLPTYIRTYLPTYVPTYLPTYIHTYIDEYIQNVHLKIASYPLWYRYSIIECHTVVLGKRHYHPNWILPSEARFSVGRLDQFILNFATPS